MSNRLFESPRQNVFEEIEEVNLEYAQQVLLNNVNSSEIALQFLRGSSKKFATFESMKKHLVALDADHQFWNIINTTRNLTLREKIINEHDNYLNEQAELDKQGKLTVEQQKNLFSAVVFEENFDNVQHMLRVIRNFQKLFKSDLAIVDNFAKMSRKVNNFEDNSNQLMKFVHNRKKLVRQLYSCYQYCKVVCAKDLLAHCYKPKYENINEDLSKNGVRVFDVSDTKNNFFLHMTEISKWSSRINKSDVKGEKQYERSKKYHYRSLSYTTAQEPLVFKDSTSYCCLVFNNFKPRNVITIARIDAFTSRFVTSKTKNSVRVFAPIVPNFVPAKTLLEMTGDVVNEISVVDYKGEEHDESMKPSAVFCSREITPTDYELAKQLGIPIYFTKHYSKTASYSTEPDTAQYNMVLDCYAQAFSDFTF